MHLAAVKRLVLTLTSVVRTLLHRVTPDGLRGARQLPSTHAFISTPKGWHLTSSGCQPGDTNRPPTPVAASALKGRHLTNLGKDRSACSPHDSTPSGWNRVTPTPAGWYVISPGIHPGETECSPTPAAAPTPKGWHLRSSGCQPGDTNRPPPPTAAPALKGRYSEPQARSPEPRAPRPTR